MNNCGSAFLGFADRLARKIKKIIRGSLMSCKTGISQMINFATEKSKQQSL